MVCLWSSQHQTIGHKCRLIPSFTFQLSSLDSAIYNIKMGTKKSITIVLLVVILLLFGVHFAVVGFYRENVKGHYLAERMLLGVNVNSLLKNYLINTESPYDLVLAGSIISVVITITLLLMVICTNERGFIKLLTLNILMMLEFAIGVVQATIINYYNAYDEMKNFITDITQAFSMPLPSSIDLNDYIILSDASLLIKNLIIADVILIFAITLPSLLFILYQLISDRDEYQINSQIEQILQNRQGPERININVTSIDKIN